MMSDALRGKTILFLGSSVTYGSAAGGVSFVEMLAEACGCRTIKEAVSGTTLVDTGEDSYIARMKRMECGRADLFVCQLSTNDASQGLPLGALDSRADCATVAGAMEYIIDYARRTWRCPVAFYTNPRYESDAYARMTALLDACAERYGVEIIDLWDDPGVNALAPEQRARYMSDPIHPTLEGYRALWLPLFERRLSEILSDPDA